jgi:hypothetical protein
LGPEDKLATMAEEANSQKPLSEKPFGYLLAAAGGLLGGPLGVIFSLAVLFALSAIMKPKNGNNPNRFLVWSLIGIIGAPLSCSPFLGNAEKKSGEPRIDNTRIANSTSDQIIPFGNEGKVREDRSLTIASSTSLSSISASNQFMEPVLSEGGRLIAVYMTIRNTGKESGNLYWTTLQLVDNQGRKYDKIEDFEESVTVNAWAKEQGMADPGDQLFPGAEAQIVAVFRVSPDAEGLRLLANKKYFLID